MKNNKLFETFKRNRVFLPVIHPVTPGTALDTFLPFVDVYLVASGIETAKYSGVLIPERTKALADKIHNFRGTGV